MLIYSSALLCSDMLYSALLCSVMLRYAALCCTGGVQGAPQEARAAAEAARRGDIPPLRLLTLDVCTAAADGADRWANPCFW